MAPRKQDPAVLRSYEVLGEARRKVCEQVVGLSVDFCLAHITLEARETLPLAASLLIDEDWRDLDEVFAADRDALAGAEPEAGYDALVSRLARIAPVSLGIVQPIETC